MSINIVNKIMAARKIYEKGFADGLANEKTVWGELAQETTLSSGSMKEYPMSFTQTEFQEWAGERTSTTLNTKVYGFGVKEMESFVKIPRTVFDDDVFEDDMWVNQFDDMGAAAARLPENLVIAAYQNGHSASSICVDDKPYFNDEHPVNYFDDSAGTFSNYYSAGMPLTKANYEQVYDEMMQRVTWMGLEMNLTPNVLLIPPQMRRTAMAIVGHDQVIEEHGTGVALVQNDNFGTARIVVSQRLMAKPTTWYLLAYSGKRRPVILMWRQKPEMKQGTPTDRLQYHVREIEYFGTARAGAGYSWPHYATKCVG